MAVPPLSPHLSTEERKQCYTAIGEFVVRQSALDNAVSSLIISWMNACGTPFIDQVFGVLEAGNKKRMLDAIRAQIVGDHARKHFKTVSETFGELLEIRNVLAHGLPYKHDNRIVMTTLSAAQAFKKTGGVDKWVYLDQLPSMLDKNAVAFNHARGLAEWLRNGHLELAKKRADVSLRDD